MSSTPFRAAFWALGFAFAMTLVLMIPNPRTIRLALHSRRPKDLLTEPQTLLASREATAPGSATTPAASPPDATIEIQSVTAATPVVERPVIDLPAVNPPPANPPAVNPPAAVRVASANPSAPIGMPVSAPAFPQNAAMAVRVAPHNSASAPPPMLDEEDRWEAASALNIPVPEPVHHDDPHHPFPEAAPQRADVPAQRAPQLAVLPAPNLPVPSTSLSRPPHEVPAPEKTTFQNGITVTESAESDRWTFSFRDAPVDQVLKTLGKYHETEVVVSDEIQGRYTEEFVDADPAQVFAIVVKTFDCAVARRGHYLLLSKQLRPRPRPTPASQATP